MSVEIQAYSPIDALKPFVAQYWKGTFYGSASVALHHKIIPSGYIDFILHFSDARCEVKTGDCWGPSSAFYLAGFWTKPFMVQFWEKVETFGIRFKPEAMGYLFGIPAAEFLNNSENLEDVFGSSFGSFCNQLESKTVEERIKLTDEYLLKRLNANKNKLSYVQAASDLIRHQQCSISVQNLSNEVCISQRQLQREFKQVFGMSPKTYMRIFRLNFVQQILDKQPNVSLAQLSYLSGYSDQAHFVKDFKRLTGNLPSAYVSGKDDILSRAHLL